MPGKPGNAVWRRRPGKFGRLLCFAFPVCPGKVCWASFLNFLSFGGKQPLVQLRGDGEDTAAAAARQSVNGERALHLPPLRSPLPLAKIGSDLFPGVQTNG